MYSSIKGDDKGGKTAKGIWKSFIKKDITHKEYKKVLFHNKLMHHKIKTIRSNNHQLGSYELNKVSLSCFDDKRYISIYSHTDIAKYKTKIKNHDFTPQL